MTNKKQENINKFFNKTSDPFVFTASKQKTQYDRDVDAGRIDPETEPKVDGRNLKEYLQYSIDNKDMLEKSFFIVIQILDSLDKQGKTKEDLAKSLGITLEEVKTYFTGEYDFDKNLELKEKIKNILNIKLV